MHGFLSVQVDIEEIITEWQWLQQQSDLLSLTQKNIGSRLSQAKVNGQPVHSSLSPAFTGNGFFPQSCLMVL